MDGTSTTSKPHSEISPSRFSLPVSRRTFLAGAAASVLSRPMFSRAASQLFEPGFLHLTTCSSGEGHVHTYAITVDRCELLGTTAIDSLAACAAHPTLPVLYVARDCRRWEHLPRAVVETYAVECSNRPLRLLAQTPMALSATGPRALALSPCGRHLLVSASTGGAWNAFALGSDGMPVSPAIARKETGTLLKSGVISLPEPQGVVFSPRGPYAVGVDPSSARMTLLQTSSEAIAVLSRCETPFRPSHLSPVWTADGRYIVAVNSQAASLSMYAINPGFSNRGDFDLTFLDTIQTETPVKALVAHATAAGVFTSRPERKGSRLQFWEIHNDRLRAEGDALIPDNILALAQHAGTLWLTSKDRLIRMRGRDLCSIDSLRVPLCGTSASNGEALFSVAVNVSARLLATQVSSV